jgi:hypothetical protein
MIVADAVPNWRAPWRKGDQTDQESRSAVTEPHPSVTAMDITVAPPPSNVNKPPHDAGGSPTAS